MFVVSVSKGSFLADDGRNINYCNAQVLLPPGRRDEANSTFVGSRLEKMKMDPSSFDVFTTPKEYDASVVPSVQGMLLQLVKELK